MESSSEPSGAHVLESPCGWFRASACGLMNRGISGWSIGGCSIIRQTKTVSGSGVRGQSQAGTTSPRTGLAIFAAWIRESTYQPARKRTCGASTICGDHEPLASSGRHPQCLINLGPGSASYKSDKNLNLNLGFEESLNL